MVRSARCSSSIVTTWPANQLARSPNAMADEIRRLVPARLRIALGGVVKLLNTVVTRDDLPTRPSSSSMCARYGSLSHLTVRSGVHRISGETLAAFRAPQPTIHLMAALGTPKPNLLRRRIRFRQARGHGPAAAMGAFHQQSASLDHVAAPIPVFLGATTIRNPRWFRLDTDTVQRGG
jgi:hypothetical protein